jgi:predicted ATPase/class 3 adenylate cyclase/Tfp pilus assembly protein PilF
MSDLPAGTVTLLFTDIEGSTRLLQRLGDAGYGRALAEHRRLLRAAFAASGGRELEVQGDGFLVVFPRASDAARAAITAQRALQAHPWPEGGVVRVRMALHSGEPLGGAEGYVGLDLHTVARICGVAHGGQILLSQAARGLIEQAPIPGVTVRDLGAHRLKDLQRPERIAQLLHPDLPPDFPPLQSLDALPNNLPHQLTSFVDRVREMAEVKRLLSAGRLVTLTGSGGCGKTRLAIQAAADLVDGFGDGVWLVELAALADHALAPQAVASAVGVREQPGRPLLATLSDHLQSRRLLLVLDNCEHLLAACAHLAYTLLSACPDVRILATSREPLGIAGETTWRVPSLSAPDPNRLPPLERLTEVDAVRLFVDRATAMLPEFRVTTERAPFVAQICHRLDGIPLAIELAAARVKVLPVEQIARRLDDAFQLLTAGSRTALLRQQTLRAAMDWSYVLLSPQEQVLFRRLAVFAGGFTLEAVEDVCSDGPVPRARVLDLLSALVDKSLVVADVQGAQGRYGMLETVRQYAREKLREADEEPERRRRHRDWFVSLAEQAELELVGAGQAAWLARLEAEHSNLLAALEWNGPAGDGNSALRLAGALSRFWWMRGHLAIGRRWTERLLERHPDASAALRARALLGAGMLAWAESDYQAASGRCEESLVLARALDDRRGIMDALNGLGLVAWAQGEYRVARASYEEALVLARALDDRRRTGVLQSNLGRVAAVQGDFAAARAHHEESLRIHREQGDAHAIATSLANLGFVAAGEGDMLRARALLEESLAIRRTLGDKVNVAASLNRLGLVEYHAGEYGRAAALVAEALILARELGDKEAIADGVSVKARLASRRTAGRDAADLWRQSLVLRRTMGDRRGLAECLEGLAAAAHAGGDQKMAVRLLAAAATIRERIGAPPLPADREEADRIMAAARARLGAEGFERSRAEGLVLSPEQAVDAALRPDP